MAAVVVQESRRSEAILIPEWVVDFATFVRWTASSDFPEFGRISFLNGAVWVDPSMEQLFTHGRLKVRITSAFETIVTAMALGYVFSDRTRLNCPKAGLSVEPDVLFVSFEAIRQKRVKLTHSAKDGYISLNGSPEVTVEIVSDSSEDKDTVQLREAYFDAGVAEYWLVDARGAKLSFEILRRTVSGYATMQAQSGGWLKSSVFGKSFRITKSKDPLGHPQFTLEHRD